MLTYNYKRIFHPRLGRFVYKHKGSGLIVDNIFNPMKRMFATATKAVLKPLAKKALKSGIESAGDKLGKKAVDFAEKKVAEKSGHLFMKDLQSLGKQVSKETKASKQNVKPKQKEEDYNIILNRLISGSGIKNKSRRGSTTQRKKQV